MKTTHDDALERVATAVLAAILSAKNEWGAGSDGQILAEIACDYAESLLHELQRRQRQEDA